MALSLTYKGFNYVSYYNGAYENADSLASLVSTGANTVALDLDYGIDVDNSTVYADSSFTDSLTALGNTIAEASANGLSVMVRPLIDFVDPSLIGAYHIGDWRSEYNPANPAAFFSSYKTMIVNEAKVAQASGAAILSLGAEMDQLTGPGYLSEWTSVISAVRAVFSGKLTYSADWDDAVSPWAGVNGLPAGTGNLATQVSFWNQLDYVGIDGYAPLSDAANPTLDQLVAGWTQVPTDAAAKAVSGNQSLISYFQNAAAAIGKPLLFTELGYESATDAASQPFGSSTNVFDPALQASLYQAFFDAWGEAGNGSLAGVYFWNWDPNAAEVGPGNGANFSPQGLPAQNVITANFTLQPPSGLALSGVSNGNNITAEATPTIVGIGQAGDTVALDDGATAIGNVTVAGNGTWSLVTSPLALGLHSLTAIETDSFGNVSAASAPFSLGVENPPMLLPIADTPATSDFFGVGMSGILSQNTNGQAGIWEMDGNSILAMGNPANPGSSWRIVGTGDFNGDGKSDILFQNSNGQVGIWEMNGLNILATGGLANPGAAWQVKGAGDFNGDGKSDILFQNTNGQVGIWEMNGLNILATGGLANPGADWQVKGTGDFNGDGKSDILFQNDSGQVGIWEMNGLNIIATGNLPNPGTSWHVIGTGDFNGDGKSDILFQNDSGQVGIWEMNGASIIATGNPQNPGSSWHAIGAGDYNGDGKSDILFQNDSGQIGIWEMNGTSIIATGNPQNPGTSWHVIS